MPFAHVHYYALKSKYIGDDELVLRNRPSIRFETRLFKGDLYKDKYGVQVQPLSYRVAYDRDGFRNDPLSSVEADIVVLGDSYIEFGLDEYDTFSRRLEATSGLSTRNLATSYHGPFQYVSTLKRYGLSLKPKYALFCFFEGNDIEDISRYLAWKTGKAYGHFNLTSKNFIQRYAIALSELFVVPLAEAAEKASRSPVEKGQNTLHPDLVALELGGTTITTVFSYKNDIRSADELLKTNEWNVLRYLLMEFKTICNENNIVPVVVFIPTKAHIYAEYSSLNSGHDWIQIRSQQIASRNNVETTMGMVCREIGMNLVSLSPVFKQFAKEGIFLYYPFDTHWDSQARQIAASFVAETLQISTRQEL
jgi:hypothetical protein